MLDRRVSAEGGVLVDVAEHLYGAVSGLLQSAHPSIDLRQPF